MLVDREYYLQIVLEPILCILTVTNMVRTQNVEVMSDKFNIV
jgi:hypothetical protein